MRKYKYVIVLALFLMGFLLVEPYLTKDCIHRWAAVADRLNPLVKEETVYIRTANSSEAILLSTAKEKTVYITTSYDNHGQARKISCHEFDKHMTSGRYLEVVTKGQNVQSWREVLPAQVPAKAREQLR